MPCELPLSLTLWFNCPNCFEGNRILKVNVLVGSKSRSSIWFRLPEPLSDEKTMTVLLYWPVVFNVVTILPIAASSAEIIPRRMTWLSNSSWTALQSRQLILFLFFHLFKKTKYVIEVMEFASFGSRLQLARQRDFRWCFWYLLPYTSYTYRRPRGYQCHAYNIGPKLMDKYFFFLGFVRYKYLSVDIFLLAVEIHELCRNLVWRPATK